MKSFLKSFYENYDYKRLKEAYNYQKHRADSIGLKKLYRLAPLEVTIKTNGKALELYFDTSGFVSMELMAVMGYFFESYNQEKDFAYTCDGGKIMKFFSEGTGFFSWYGANITLDVDEKGAERIVNLFINRYSEKDMAIFKMLCDNIKRLEKENWSKYRKWVEDNAAQEKEKKHIQEVTCMDLPMDWDNAFAQSPAAQGVHVDSIPDGLILSLNNLGRVDIEYIAQISGADCKEVICALKGSIYQNPDTWSECFYKGWETADEYLSGRVAHKLRRAKIANERYNGYFRDNIAALEKVLPRHVSGSDIYITLGSPWVPTEIIDDFIVHLFGDWERGVRDSYLPEVKQRYSVKHDDITGGWDVPKKSRYLDRNVAVTTTYGTKRINGMHILEDTLNLKPATVYDKVSVPGHKSKKSVLNKDETLIAQEKQKAMIKEFQKWVWSDKGRKRTLEEIYDSRFASTIVRHFDGSFLSFPQKNPDCELYAYQKNAVARILFTPNTLLAHDVGSGKTFIMIAAGMEMKRMGLSKKNMYVVPNNIVGQWRDMFTYLYPKAQVMTVDSKSFTKAKREEVLETIRDGDFDAVIISYSCFEAIPVSKDFYLEEMNEQLEKMNRLMTRKNKATSKLMKRKAKLEEEIEELKDAIYEMYDGVYFEDLGINTLFVDEAHNFKNLKLNTTIQCMGINAKGSAKCTDMADKVRAVQKANNGRGVVMATGTPITNSLTDIYVMQRYLQLGELTLMGLGSFDSWVGMFAERNTEFEIDVDTSNFRMATRLTKFHNLPELSAMLSAAADFHKADKENGIPLMNGYKDVLIGKTDDFEAYLKMISLRASNVREGLVNRTEDNMLKITTDGRKAALDMRLVDKLLPFTYQSKVAHCAENVLDIYLKTMEERSAQLVFCDSSTPKIEFNLYDELKRLLVKMGVRDEEIAFIHSADSEKERKKLFEEVRKGDIRVLIGSTFKLGLGVNVQERLVAMHHLDVPWRPADMVQREGRILRQGNRNEEVYIYRYITQGSFDSYSWQLLETKQRMIVSILSGCMEERSCGEVDDTVLDYAEVKALAVGNPLIKRRVEVANEIAKNKTLQHEWLDTRQQLEVELLELPHKLARQNKLIEDCEKDIVHYEQNKAELNDKERKSLRHSLFTLLGDNVLAREERIGAEYQGFKIILPTAMISERPFVYVEAAGRYMVELGIMESSILIRIDNFLDKLAAYRDKLAAKKEGFKVRMADIEEELKNSKGYTDLIKALEEELKSIDKQLGVKK